MKLLIKFLSLILLTTPFIYSHAMDNAQNPPAKTQSQTSVNKENNELCYYNKKLERICHKFNSNLTINIPRTGTSGGGCGGSSKCGNNNYELEWLREYNKLNPKAFDKHKFENKLKELEKHSLEKVK